MSITGGIFQNINGGTTSIYSENVSKFVSGGTFDKSVNANYLANNCISKIVDGKNKIGIEYNATISTPTNGTITLDKTKSFAGETITITTTPTKDYELKSLVVKKGTSEVTVTNNTFVMPSGDVRITAIFEKISTVIDVPVLEPTTIVTEPTVGVKEEEKIQNVLLDSLSKNNTLSNIANDKSVTVGIEIKKLSEDNLDDEVINLIKDKVGKGVISTFFDISVLVKDAKTNEKVGQLEELTSEIELMILLPEDLKNTSQNIDRKYFVVREHESKIELIEAKLSEDGKYLLFKTDKFSTYAFGYKDKVAEANPNTGDNIFLYVKLGCLSLIVLVGMGLYLKKKRFN